MSSKRLGLFEAEGCILFSLIHWFCPHCLELGHKDERKRGRGREREGRGKEEEKEKKEREGRKETDTERSSSTEHVDIEDMKV